jgi:release factor glutamine methyltransferase
LSTDYPILNRPLSKLAATDKVQGVYGAEDRSVLKVREDRKHEIDKAFTDGVELQNRANKSFSRRVGKSLSTQQKYHLQHSLPNHLFSLEKLSVLQASYNKVFLEIGVGMGEHFIHQATQAPENLFIGAEVYLNGVASVLRHASEYEINNFLLWPDDIDRILSSIPSNSLSGIYILFPDPWPKRRDFKKRLINELRLPTILDKLKSQASLWFASDIEDYVNSVLKLATNIDGFVIRGDENNFSTPHANYIQTKYHKKALEEGRVASFIELYKK